MSEQNQVDPLFLLIQQVQADAQTIQQYMSYVYDREHYDYWQRQAALKYLFIQTRHLEDLVKSLYAQYDQIQNHMRIELEVSVEYDNLERRG
jgi:predicted Mrr-cat superfamily restriction endonuclease